MSTEEPQGRPVEPSSATAHGAAPVSRPSPYESIPTPSHPQTRAGAGPDRKPGPLAWLLADLPLKILSLVLAVMVWRVVHDSLERPVDVHEVRVEIVGLPKDVRLVQGNSRVVTLGLKGPGSEVERVASEFQSPGARATRRIPLDAFTGDHGELPEVSDAKELSYSIPGAKDVAVKISPPIRVTWYRVEEREFAVDTPDIVPFPGRTDLQPAPGYPTVEPATLKVTGPLALFKALERGARVKPDPIDARAWLAQDPDLTVPFDWKSGFERWRAGEETRSPQLVTFDPPQIRGKLRLRLTSSVVLENALQVLYPPGTDADSYKGFAWEISGTGAEYDRTTGRVRLAVRGEQRAVEDMKAKPTDWCFAVELPPPPGAGEAAKSNEKSNVFLWLKQDAPPAVRLDGHPTVFVTLKAR